MNIFALHIQPEKAAEMHCDKHVVKMIVETAQMVSTAFDRHGMRRKWMTKPCWQNHPCTIWAGNNRTNLKWLIYLGLSLLAEYKKRYEKQHAYHGMFLLFLKMINDENNKVSHGKFEVFALAVPPELKAHLGREYTIIQAINVYRLYYIRDKKEMAKYKLGNVPHWLKGEVDLQSLK